jgi:hypothetical protein
MVIAGQKWNTDASCGPVASLRLRIPLRKNVTPAAFGYTELAIVMVASRFVPIETSDHVAVETGTVVAGAVVAGAVVAGAVVAGAVVAGAVVAGAVVAGAVVAGAVVGVVPPGAV